MSKPRATKLLDDCFVHDHQRMRHDDAIVLLRARVRPVTATCAVFLDAAHGRILAAPVFAPRPIPAFSNAAVDGYGFAFRDYDPGAGSLLAVSERITAGHPASRPGRDARVGRAVRIFTGAVVPDGIDTVAMQEDVQVVGPNVDSVPRPGDGKFAEVVLPAGFKRGANVRLAGEDVAAGSQLFAAGHVLRPQDLAALASAGLASVLCHEPLRVGIFSTGDEIILPGSEPGIEPEIGKVYDANAAMLGALITLAGGVSQSLGVLPDDAAVVRERLLAASRQFDLLITSGGASRGEEDHVVRTLDAIGRRHLWQIAVKPGRPMSFGQIGDCVFLGLPGNPVAVFVCFLLYGYPMVRALAGGAWPEPRRLRLRSASAVKKKTGRREYWRATLIETPRGLEVEKFARDGSGLITSLRVADGLIEADEDTGAVAVGDEVTFIAFSDYGIAR